MTTKIRLSVLFCLVALALLAGPTHAETTVCTQDSLCSSHSDCGGTFLGFCLQFGGGFGTCECHCGEEVCGEICGNGVCDAPQETSISCPADCVIQCGDHVCHTPNESYSNCPADCPSPCGDGICGSGEGCSSCQADCGPCNPTGCNQGATCSANADCGTDGNCSQGTCECGEEPNPISCGNGICEMGEDCNSCQLDCGPCFCLEGAICSTHSDCGGTTVGVCNSFGGGYGTCTCF